ncbi:hypothetical protein RclHR1_08090010 [Rhizophagus clarus]|uniref:Uncharacterized protein n=1 Tax=Rhizophagus clarus TaxID=94130 RepID=A0A2Z6RZT0_9GLOM|nr:hypothetical protein RclHR1_08090010 [Rhizophagus clarus]GES89678.1 hypothetical protein GLOIN_2v1782692 [Rhizophagus clarus]
MSSLRLIINSSLSRKIQFPSPTTCTQIFLRLRQKSTSTTSTNTASFSQSHTSENITVWNVYGPPFINCFLIGSITYISLHVFWYKLAFIELREEMENKVNELESKIDSLKKKMI